LGYAYIAAIAQPLSAAARSLAWDETTMTAVALDFLFAAFVAVVGLGAGWWLRGGLTRQASSSPRSDQADAHVAHSKEVLARLHELAAAMAADVDEHSTRVQEISDELNASDEREAEDVVTAVARIIQANERMQQQLTTAEERLHEQERQIESHVVEARTDALTQVANRRAFDDAMLRCVSEFQSRQRPSTVMLIDVDHFKLFNDTHGHQAGDEVLRGVARVLRQSLDKSVMVARYGGEEFAVIFPGAKLSAVRVAAERARVAIREARFRFEGLELHVAASSGLAELLPNETAANLIKRSDEALYMSKEAGRDCGHWHDGELCHLIVQPVAEVASVEPVEPATERDPEPDGETATLASASSEPEPEAAPVAPAVASTPAPVFDVGMESGVSDVERRDTLTGLSNRSVFEQELSRRVAEWKRGGAIVTIMLIEVDRYRRVLTDKGTTGGNVVLRAATQFLKAAMREMDHVARFDEAVFALMLPAAALPEATGVAERLRRAVSGCKLPLDGGSFRFTISLGLAQVGGDDDLLRLIERGQTALESAVQSGGNATYVHNGTSCEPARKVPAAVS
jgi:diguanylate cyclase